VKDREQGGGVVPMSRRHLVDHIATEDEGSTWSSPARWRNRSERIPREHLSSHRAEKEDYGKEKE